MSGSSGDSSGLSKLSTALIVVLVISVVALFAQLLYSWWRRRVFRRQINTDQLNIYNSSSDSSFSYKELIYFFCIRSHSRIESKSVTATSTNGDRNSNRRSDIELLKLQGIFAPPRFLFTIKEEDREDLELPADKSIFFQDKEVNKIDGDSRFQKVSLEECFTAADESAVAVEIDVDDGCDTTPFSTPCASPAYFTPLASPVHKVIKG
ncbi:hypothetical protein BUALT_Bualt09G0103800 [Buddleja alternifolia]|uniref:Uncharacterized protein n=1 Tax=Buddleja alternifolia TaxID=168488 RepID=A0AAV6X8T4_9LAMI|nr:hypothetical protein BUALT_Bualt09G0103800 [Buddleja alternifolia]